MEKKISVIIPVYNIERYIKNTINSILAQEYKNIEIIIVDDGSIDNSAANCDELLKLNCSESINNIIVVHKTNGGVSSARLTGVKASSGQWIGFVDGDDTIASDMYKRLLDNAMHFKSDISHCGHRVIRPNGQVEDFYGTGRLVQQDQISGLQSLISGSFEPGLCNKLYHYTLLHNLFHSGAMDYSIKINEDLLMNYFLFKLADSSVYEDVCLYNYTKREGSASQSYNRNNIWDPIHVKEIIRDDCKKTDLESTARAAYLSTCLTAYHGILRQDKSFVGDKKAVFTLIKQNQKDKRFTSSRIRVMINVLVRFPLLYNLIRKLYGITKE